MIEFVKGDFFGYPADIRVNTVNYVVVMGVGVALLFKNKFPKMYEEYLRECNQRKVKLDSHTFGNKIKFLILQVSQL